MRPTEILMEEHRVIERVLDALDRAASRLENGPAPGPEFFLGATEFIRGFADAFHHMKEEDVLFTALADHGIPREGGPVAVMLFEHGQGREFTRAMQAAAERWKGGDAAARAEVAVHARHYTGLLRQHILKEDEILFRMADRVLPSDVQDQMVADFERVERERTAPGTRQRYLDLASRLEAQAGRGESA